MWVLLITFVSGSASLPHPHSRVIVIGFRCSESHCI